MISIPATVETEETAQIERNLLEGVVSRAGTLYLTWSFIAVLYGFLSIDIFRSKIPDLTLWENVWPRFLYSGLPILIVALSYKLQPKKQTKLKAWMSVILLPVFLISSSMVHAWPLFWSGHYDFYLQFHASNIIGMASGIFAISASPRLVFAQCLGFIAIYFGPLLLLFAKAQPVVSQVIVSDTLISTIILLVTLKSVHRLRFALASAEHRRHKKTSSFLGKHLTDAIYQDRQMVPDNYSRDGLIMSIDLRGYTKFFQSNDPNMVRAFMSDYYSLATKTLSTKKAYLHKTIGDGLLISFGIMDNETDLSDLPEAQALTDKMNSQKMTDLTKQAVDVFFGIAQGLEDLTKKHSVTGSLMIGAGCAFGPIEVLVRGEENSRQELDIQGNTIIKSVRLEAYSKLLNKNIDFDSSFLILAPELMNYTCTGQGFKTLMITKPESRIRDFPEINTVLYRQWKHGPMRGSSGLKAA